MKVYLAGPISGLSYEEAVGWREYAKKMLEEHGIQGYSPMRAKQYMKDIEKFHYKCDYGDLGPLSTARAIMMRDRYDATSCDLLLVNFLGAKIPSLGTAMEIAWADLKRTPIICVMEEGNIHNHAMITEAIGICVPTLEEAIHMTVAVLKPH